MYWERVYQGRTESGELESSGSCTISGNAGIILLALIAVANIIALILANVQAYQTRELKSAFSESKYVGLAMASILQAFLIGVPLLFLSESSPTARYLVRSILVFVICMSVLLFIFVPKMITGNANMDDQPFSVSHHSSSVAEIRRQVAEESITE